MISVPYRLVQDVARPDRDCRMQIKNVLNIFAKLNLNEIDDSQNPL
jgi:hypothetical protein